MESLKEQVHEERNKDDDGNDGSGDRIDENTVRQTVGFYATDQFDF